MVTYWNQGSRYYDVRPLVPYARGFWEFQCILEGGAIPLLEADPIVGRGGVGLWVFGPQCRHGWSATSSEPSEICVLHFEDRSAAPLGDLVPLDGAGFVPLGKRALRSFLSLHAEAKPLVFVEGLESSLQAEVLFRRLCLLWLEQLPAERRQSRRDTSASRVCEQVLRWYREQLEEGVGVEQAAAFVGVSTAHLRRLFQAHFGSSPRRVLAAEKLRRTLEMIRSTDHSFEQIADSCGFSEVSDLSRFVLRETGMRPSQHRRKH